MHHEPWQAGLTHRVTHPRSGASCRRLLLLVGLFVSARPLSPLASDLRSESDAAGSILSGLPQIAPVLPTANGGIALPHAGPANSTSRRTWFAIWESDSIPP